MNMRYLAEEHHAIATTRGDKESIYQFSLKENSEGGMGDRMNCQEDTGIRPFLVINLDFFRSKPHFTQDHHKRYMSLQIKV